MKKLLIYGLLGIATITIILAIQTKKTEVLKSEYIPWMENPENGFKVVEKLGDYSLSCQYKPSEYIVLKERKGFNKSIEKINNSIQEFDHQLFFSFTVANKNHGFGLFGNKQISPDLFTEKKNYYTFDGPNNFVLTYGKDTIPNNFTHLEQTIGIKPFSTFLLGFEKPYKKYPKKNMTLYFKEEFAEFPTQKFVFKRSAIKKQPTLKN